MLSHDMISRALRFAGWPALLASSALVACSSKPQAPDAFVFATVNQSSIDHSACNVSSQQTALSIGTATGTDPTRVSDGEQQNGAATVHVTCSVTPSGGGFDIKLVVEQEGLNGGSLTITSPPGKGAVSQQGGMGVTGVFQSDANGSYSETDCTIAYTYGYPPAPVPVDTPISAGRIWGHLSCPKANLAGVGTLPDGGSQFCDAEADFIFENCGQ
jgi:hypothetical protein